eukprot:1240338-Alexandrium_andersonii.AAC.1
MALPQDSTSASRIPTNVVQALHTACSSLQQFAAVSCAASPAGLLPPQSPPQKALLRAPEALLVG